MCLTSVPIDCPSNSYAFFINYFSNSNLFMYRVFVCALL